MDVYVARQAIFDINKHVVAYELLFRNSNINQFISIENSNPTPNVINNSFSVIGLDKLTEGKRAFINFDEALLKSGIIESFPEDCIAIEILETVFPDNIVIEHCKNLKQKGYIIALDDFEYNENFDELIKYIDIIKIDFFLTKGKERKEIMHKIKNKKIKFLAEKVETEEEYKEALEYGYSYFQGYFFCKPVIVSGKDIPAYKFTYTELLKELNKPNISLTKIENLIKNDVSISYKLFKIANSAHYSMKTEITSIRNAILLIGLIDLKRWVYIIALKSMNENKIDELINISLIRASFAELLNKKMHLIASDFEVFLTGLFSLMDALLNRPIEDILRELPVSKYVKDALSGGKNILSDLLELIIMYEKGNWEQVNKLTKQMGLNRELVSSCYLQSIENLKDLYTI